MIAKLPISSWSVNRGKTSSRQSIDPSNITDIDPIFLQAASNRGAKVISDVLIEGHESLLWTPRL